MRMIDIVQTLKKRLLYHYCQLYLTGKAWRWHLSVSGRSDDKSTAMKAFKVNATNIDKFKKR